MAEETENEDEEIEYVVTNHLGEEISPRTESREAAFRWMETKRPGRYPAGMGVSEIRS